MHLEIIKHDGPARLGKMHIHEGWAPTPTVMWSPAAGPTPKASIQIAPPKTVQSTMAIVTYGTVFSEEDMGGVGILPSHPSGYDVPHDLARTAVDNTIRFAAGWPEMPAVIEGGRHLDLRLQCAIGLGERPLVKIADSNRLVKNHRKLVECITSIRESISPNTALYMSGIPPHLFPILAYMGVDLFDVRAAILGAHEGAYLTQRKAFRAQSLREPLCPCKVCRESPPMELGFEELLYHNLSVTEAAAQEIREAIRSDELRGLVEERAASDPVAMGALRILDIEKRGFLEKYTPLTPRKRAFETKRERVVSDLG